METPQNFKDVPIFTGEAEVLPVQDVPQAIPQVPMLRSQTQYHTAVSVQKPRNLDKVVTAVLHEAVLAGEGFYWSWPVYNKKTKKTENIFGPSIGCAMAVAREMTNCAVPVDYQETVTEWVFTAHFVDLEKGFTVSRIYRKRKYKVKPGEPWGDRKEDMEFQAAQSRAIRNVVSAGAPRWLIDQAVDAAKNAVFSKITPEKLAEAKDKLVKLFAGYGIEESHLVAAVGFSTVQWTPQEITTLKGMFTQIREGQASPGELFPGSDQKKVVETKPKPPEPAGEEFRSQASPEPHLAQEPPTTAITENQGPSLEELLSKLNQDEWPIEKLQIKFGKPYGEWGETELKILADMAGE